MAASEAAKAHNAETSDRKQEEATGPPNPAEAEPLIDSLPERQFWRISIALASVVLSSGW